MREREDTTRQRKQSHRDINHIVSCGSVPPNCKGVSRMFKILRQEFFFRRQLIILLVATSVACMCLGCDQGPNPEDTNSIVSNNVERPAKNNQTFDIRSSSNTKSGSARFTGNHTEVGVDSDKNEKYNFLRAEAEIEVKKSGNYGIYGFLMFNDTEITSRPSARSAAPSYYYLSSDPTIRTITMNFSGEDIYESKKSGNYTVYMRLIDETGACIDRASFETNKFSYKEFGEEQ